MDNMCNICEHVFSTKYNLKRHKLTSKCVKFKSKEEYKFICNSCNKKYKTKYILNKHIVKCNGGSYIIKNNNKYECRLCNKAYVNKCHAYRHNKKCRETNSHIIKQKESDKKHKLLITKNKINKINSNNKINKVNSDNYNNSIVGNNNTINNYITILPFGKENMDIPDDIKKLILNKGFKAVEALTMYTHLNKNRPENHNVYKTNVKNKLLNVYNGKRWLVKDEEDVIDDVYVLKKAHLEDWLEEFCHELTGVANKKVNRFFDHSEDETVANKIKKDIKLMLYNYRDRVLKTIKESDN